MTNSIYTIGTGNHNLLSLKSILKQNGVTLLIDIRSKPFGWNKELNMPNLRTQLNYLWMGKVLGGFSEHYKERSDTWVSSIHELVALSKDNVICIMCSEEDPNRCHRLDIAKALEDEGVTVIHIRNMNVLETNKPDGFVKPVPKPKPKQGDLFEIFTGMM